MHSNKNLETNIGAMIRTIRKSLNMTQKELADRLKISAQQVHKYESGIDHITLSKVYKIAEIFHCDVSILIGTDNTKSNLMVAEKKVNLDYFNKITTTDNNTEHQDDNDNAVFLLKKYFSLKKNDRLKVIDFLNSITKK